LLLCFILMALRETTILKYSLKGRDFHINLHMMKFTLYSE
jgi:hypothetical protein